MNTGIQKSSLTPFGSSTTTTPVGSQVKGCLTDKKNVFEIVAAHDIPYAATASIGYLQDFINKVERAKNMHGTRFIHVMAPCPTGWGHATDVTADIAKEAVDCGMWYLAEFEGSRESGVPGGAFKLNRNPKEFSDIEHYLRGQKRFKHMSEDDVQHAVAGRDAKWEFIRSHWA